MTHRLALLLVLPSVAGCILSSPTSPMRVLDHTTQRPERARGLVVFLPGLGDDAGRFAEHGLVQTVKQRTSYDAIAAGAHFGYYRVFNVIPRLRQDVIGPARAMGYDEIWLVGTSMGGFGALAYAESYPEDVAGVVLIAPYLGEAEVVEEIARSGLEAWDPGPIEALPEGRERRTREIWVWIRRQLRAEDGTGLWLAYGAQDRGADEHAVLARELPEARRLVRPGGHTWSTWAPLFADLVPSVLPPAGDELTAGGGMRSAPERRPSSGASAHR